MTWLNVGAGTHLAPEPWINVDRVRNIEHHVEPDLIGDPLGDWPFGEASADRIYLGHVLEHVPWPRTPEFAKVIYDTAKPGAEVGVCGPDTYITIEEWSRGNVGWDLVKSVLEHAAPWRDGGEGWQGARHEWNCTDARALDVMLFAGFELVQSYTWHLADMAVDWPVVTPTIWQFGFVVRKPA